jgi:hypothetical protein
MSLHNPVAMYGRGAMKPVFASAIALATALSLGACGKQGGADRNAKNDAEVRESAFPEQVYWGDTHLHTSNSSDAFSFGVRLGPEEALRFAMGEEVSSSTGIKAKLSRPLDFLVIADHSDGLAVMRSIYEAPRLLIRDPLIRRWHDMLQQGPEGSQKVAAELIDGFSKKTLPASMLDQKASDKRTRSTWDEHLDVVERYNNPGKFSAFVGFEYTLMPKGDNLHRVVVFRDGQKKAKKVLPFSSFIGTSPDDLWNYMDAYEKATGGKILAIPHNSNVSNGLMFEMTQPGGGAMTAAYARRRAAHEPLVEATQIKGDSEAHPFLSPNDEFADYGKAGWELGNLTMESKKTPDMFAGEYVREALKRGLRIEQMTGVNPYKFGMIGSTDSHTALATGDEDNFFGKHSGVEPNAKRAIEPQNLGTRVGRFGWHYLAGGYAAVWAKANTRGAIFDAMTRKEVYATTGSRMQVRMFGGWDFNASDLKADWVKAGYTRGVPMGADLKPGKGTPKFIISALKDPMGANLDRIQVVKGWVDKAGKLHEQIFNVAWSDPAKRPLLANGKLASVGDTVDLATATYANSIGAAQLQTVWTDPSFDPGTKAFYYLRVLEIPTPRWVAYDAVRFKVKMPPEMRMKDQERAYTSPIWYSPKS